MIEFLAFIGVLAIIYIIGFVIVLFIIKDKWMGPIVALLWPLFLIGEIIDLFKRDK